MKKILIIFILFILTGDFCFASTIKVGVTVGLPELFLPLISEDSSELSVKTYTDGGRIVYKIKKNPKYNLAKALDRDAKNVLENNKTVSFDVYDHKLYLDKYVIDYSELMTSEKFRDIKGGLFKFNLKDSKGKVSQYELIPGMSYAILRFSGNKNQIFGYGDNSIIPVYADLMIEEGVLNLLDGSQVYKVNILPQGVEEKISKISDINSDLIPKEVYITVDDYHPAYVIRVQDRANLFGIFPIKKELIYKLDAKNNKFFNYKKPWYLSHGEFYKKWQELGMDNNE